MPAYQETEYKEGKINSKKYATNYNLFPVKSVCNDDKGKSRISTVTEKTICKTASEI